MDLRRTIERIAPLTDLESGLVTLAQSGDRKARRRVAEAYLNLVCAIAVEICPDPEDIDEAVAEGSIALITALDRFDPAKDRPFASFARAWIEGEIRRWVLENSGARRLRRGARGAQRNEFIPAPPYTSLDAHLPGSTADVSTLHDLLPIGTGADTTEINARPVPSAEDMVLAREDVGDHMRSRIGEALSGLTPYEREVIERTIMAEEPVSLQTIATERGVSRQMVDKTQKRALAKVAEHRGQSKRPEAAA